MTNNEDPAIAKMGTYISSQLTAMLAYWDKNQQCKFANNAYIEWFGKTPEQIQHKMSMQEVLGETLYQKNLPHINAALDGHVQVFERSVTIPGGDIRNALVTYTADIIEDKVEGFFVHVADVTHIKKLEQKLAASRKDLLRTIIDTQETERQEIGVHLRDNVNQTLVYCNMMLQVKRHTEEDSQLHKEVNNNIKEAISELNILSTNLLPSGTEFLGLVKGVENYIQIFSKRYKVKINFACANSEVENLEPRDKLCVFRIIQDYLLILAGNKSTKKIDISIQYKDGLLTLLFKLNDVSYIFNKESNKFKNIALRVEYYAGVYKEIQTETESILEIKLMIGL